MYINGKGTYDDIIKNIETIQEKTNKRVMARAIIDPDLEDISLAHLKRDLYEKGVDVVSIEFPWVKDSDDMSLNEEKLSKIIKNIREYGYEFISSIKKDDYSIIGLAPFSKTLKDLINRTNVASSRACCAGASSMAITVNGDLYPCHTFVGHEEFRMGSLTEGITNKNINDIFRNYSADTVEQCKKCEIQYNCTRRCPADSFLFNGDIYKPNEFRCKLQKEFFKTTMYIYYELSKMKDKKRMVQIMYNKLNEYNKNM
ncbi:SPASM domain-containing protein [Paraclostridium sp. AKS46]|nr:SPASM domain-containing protein [Paraclostridium sp. AKS46]